MAQSRSLIWAIHMLSRNRRRIARELVDQTRSHSEKQREDYARKQAAAGESERKSEEIYVPSENFCRVFSLIIGKRQRANRNVKLGENPRFKTMSKENIHQSEDDETEHTTQDLNPEPRLCEAQHKSEEPEQKEENTSKPSQPSVFERLSHGEAFG